MDDLTFSIRRLRKERRDGAGFTLELTRLDIGRGERVALVGPSGCGKSTALDTLAAVLRPDDAETFLFSPRPGTVVDVMAAWRAGQRDALAHLRLHHVGYVLQTGGLLPFLSARENIALARDALGLPRQDNGVARLAERLGIARLLDTAPGRLSVGERQRVAIARALAAQPSVVLADEPTAALDPLNARSVLKLFSALAEDMGITVILVTHAPDEATTLGFRQIPVRLRRDGEQVRACVDTGGTEEVAPCA